MKIKFTILIFSILLLNLIISKIISNSSTQNREINENEFLKLVNLSDLENLKKILDLDQPIKRKILDKAIIISAQKGDTEIFKLLETRVSRKAHRQAYYILLEKNIDINFDQDFKEII